VQLRGALETPWIHPSRSIFLVIAPRQRHQPLTRYGQFEVSGRRLVTIALFVSTFLVSLDMAVISTAMPTVIGQIGGIHLYAWVFSAYLLTSTVTVPIYGKLADLYGRKPVYLVATTIFLVASMLCGQSQSMEQLIAFRLLQGVGAGGMLPITQTVLGDLYSLEERARIVGVFSSVWGISGLLGPAIGGFLTEHASWRWAFYVNTPLCILTILLIARFLHERIEHKQHRIDYPGAIILSAAVVALLVGLQNQQPLLYLLAAVLAPAFIWQERRAPEPLVPLHLFRQRVIGFSTLGAVLIGWLVSGQSTFVPPFLQGVLGATPTIAGFVMAGASIGWPAASAVAGPLVLRLGFRVPCVAGAVLLAAAYVLMWTMPSEVGLWYPTLAQFIAGFGFGFTSLVFILAAQNAVGWDQRGVVTGANQFARSIGGTIGVSIAGVVFSSGVAAATVGAAVNPNDLLSPSVRAGLPATDLQQLESALAGALHSVYFMFVVVAVLCIVVAALLPGGRPPEPVPADEKQRPRSLVTSGADD
jgi:EmrB/QacA subfamily drug resistance transporter